LAISIREDLTSFRKHLTSFREHMSARPASKQILSTFIQGTFGVNQFELIWHRSGNIWHPSGDVWHYSGNIWHPSGNIWHYSGNIWHPSGNIWHPSGNICQQDLQASKCVINKWNQPSTGARPIVRNEI
jgi:hypothetical protein